MNEGLDDMAVAEPPAGEELERLMARYARVRLDPGQAQVRRARAVLMEDAWRRRIDPTGVVVASGRRWPARRGPFAGWSVRRLAVSMSAAVLAGLVIGASAFASSRAGGPLYEARVALETVALPSDIASRVDAQLVRAQARLADAIEAAGRHDDPATTAALDAYDATISDLGALGGEVAARALEAVRFHRSILLGIEASVPDGAADGLDRAIANSDRVIESLAAAGGGTGAGAPAGSGGTNGGGNADPGGRPGDRPAEPTAKPGRTAEPGATATPKPDRTRQPEATAKPGRTAPPRRTPEPGQQPDGDLAQPEPSDDQP